MKPRVLRLASSCFGSACWAVAYGPLPVARFAAWPDALEFALALRFGPKPRKAIDPQPCSQCLNPLQKGICSCGREWTDMPRRRA